MILVSSTQYELLSRNLIHICELDSHPVYGIDRRTSTNTIFNQQTQDPDQIKSGSTANIGAKVLLYQKNGPRFGFDFYLGPVVGPNQDQN